MTFLGRLFGLEGEEHPQLRFPDVGKVQSEPVPSSIGKIYRNAIGEKSFILNFGRKAKTPGEKKREKDRFLARRPVPTPITLEPPYWDMDQATPAYKKDISQRIRVELGEENCLSKGGIYQDPLKASTLICLRACQLLGEVNPIPEDVRRVLQEIRDMQYPVVSSRMGIFHALTQLNDCENLLKIEIFQLSCKKALSQEGVQEIKVVKVRPVCLSPSIGERKRFKVIPEIFGRLSVFSDYFSHYMSSENLSQNILSIRKSLNPLESRLNSQKKEQQKLLHSAERCLRESKKEGYRLLIERIELLRSRNANLTIETYSNRPDPHSWNVFAWVYFFFFPATLKEGVKSEIKAIKCEMQVVERELTELVQNAKRLAVFRETRGIDPELDAIDKDLQRYREKNSIFSSFLQKLSYILLDRGILCAVKFLKSGCLDYLTTEKGALELLTKTNGLLEELENSTKLSRLSEEDELRAEHELQLEYEKQGRALATRSSEFFLENSYPVLSNFLGLFQSQVQDSIFSDYLDPFLSYLFDKGIESHYFEGFPAIKEVLASKIRFHLGGELSKRQRLFNQIAVLKFLSGFFDMLERNRDTVNRARDKESQAKVDVGEVDFQAFTFLSKHLKVLDPIWEKYVPWIFRGAGRFFVDQALVRRGFENWYLKDYTQEEKDYSLQKAQKALHDLRMTYRKPKPQSHKYAFHFSNLEEILRTGAGDPGGEKFHRATELFRKSKHFRYWDGTKNLLELFKDLKSKGLYPELIHQRDKGTLKEKGKELLKILKEKRLCDSLGENEREALSDMIESVQYGLSNLDNPNPARPFNLLRSVEKLQVSLFNRLGHLRDSYRDLPNFDIGLILQDPNRIFGILEEDFSFWEESLSSIQEAVFVHQGPKTYSRHFLQDYRCNFHKALSGIRA